MPSVSTVGEEDCSGIDADGTADDPDAREDILDYFDQDDLDFVDTDWDRLDVDSEDELATSGSSPGSANWMDSSDRLPTRFVEPTEHSRTSAGPSFDTQSMTDFWAKGSSSPQAPERTPTLSRTEIRERG